MLNRTLRLIETKEYVVGTVERTSLDKKFHPRLILNYQK